MIGQDVPDNHAFLLSKYLISHFWHVWVAWKLNVTSKKNELFKEQCVCQPRWVSKLPKYRRCDGATQWLTITKLFMEETFQMLGLEYQPALHDLGNSNLIYHVDFWDDADADQHVRIAKKPYQVPYLDSFLNMTTKESDCFGRTAMMSRFPRSLLYLSHIH